MSYVVTAPLVCAQDQAGSVGYFYEGAVLPSSVKASEAKRLLADGMVVESEAPVAPKKTSGS